MLLKKLIRPKNTRKIKLLSVLRLPPPFGGGELLNLSLYNAKKSDSYHHFLILGRKSHSKSKQLNPNIISVFYGDIYIFKAIITILTLLPDRLHLTLPKSFLAFFRNSIIVLLASSMKIDVVAELHGMEFKFLNKKIKIKYFHFIMKRIKKLRVLSNSIKRYITDVGYKNDIHIIDNGIEAPKTSSISRTFSGNSINILYIGAISESKGFLRLLEVFENLNNSLDSNFKVIVIGEWESMTFKSKAVAFIQQKNISERVIFKGKLINDSKWHEINKCHLHIHLTSFDGQPLTIIETMSQGIPCIATKIGAIPEMIVHKKNGFLVDDYISETLEIVKDLISGRQDYSKISEEAKKTFNTKYTLENYLKKMNDFLTS